MNARQFRIDRVKRKDDQREGSWTEVSVTEMSRDEPHTIIINGWHSPNQLREELTKRLQEVSLIFDMRDSESLLIGEIITVERGIT